jgi:hypothetical protein
VLKNNPSGRARSTSQKPNLQAPVQLVKTPTVVRRHRSSLICCTTDEGTAGQRSDNAENWEEEDESVAIHPCPPTEGRLPFIDGPPQPLDLICYILGTAPWNIFTCNHPEISHVTCVPVTPVWRGSLGVIFDNQINKRQKLNCRLEHVTTRSSQVTR